MSEQVERKLLALLGNPTESPYGTPIPGLDEFGLDSTETFLAGVTAVSRFEGEGVVRRLGEPLQVDVAVLRLLQDAGIRPGATVTVERAAQSTRVAGPDGVVELAPELAAHLYIVATA